MLEGCFQIHQWRKAKITLGDVDITDIASESVDIREQVAVYKRQSCERADFHLLNITRIEEMLCSLFAKALFGFYQLDLIRDV
jgi:hypothetical protein